MNDSLEYIYVDKAIIDNSTLYTITFKKVYFLIRPIIQIRLKNKIESITEDNQFYYNQFIKCFNPSKLYFFKIHKKFIKELI